MKALYIFLLFLCTSQLWAFSGAEGWKAANTKGKVRLLTGYQEFFRELAKTESSTYAEWKVKQTFLWKLLINEAWADGEMDCIYAGWPSRRINNLCSSPERNNPQYEKGTCRNSEMQCQPRLFGKGLCVPTATREQRNLAFSNCDKKFKSSGKTLENVVKEVQTDSKESDLLELMGFADKICSSGKQVGTGMCNRLKSVVEEMRPYIEANKSGPKPEETVSSLPVVPEAIPLVIPAIIPEVTPKITQVSIPEEVTGKSETSSAAEVLILELADAVETATQGLTTVEQVNAGITPEDCEPEKNGASFLRDEPRDFEFEYVVTKLGSDPAWRESFQKDQREETLRPRGFTFTNVGENHIAGKPLTPEEKVEREWRFVTTDQSMRETYLWLTDDAGAGFLSQMTESIILIFPRKMMPAIEARGEDLLVTLPTGEKVVYDKKTKTIKNGVMSEGPVASRSPANVKYNGTGISIRINAQGKDPRLASQTATITQNGKTCQVPTRDLWRETDFKYANDNELLTFLNQKCKNRFSMP